MLYCPEMNEVAAPRLFHSEYNFRDSYSLSFLVANEAQASAVLKKLRIRPAFGIKLVREEMGAHSDADRLGGPVFHCLITSGAHRKLMNSDATAYRSLLD